MPELSCAFAWTLKRSLRYTSTVTVFPFWVTEAVLLFSPAVSGVLTTERTGCTLSLTLRWPSTTCVEPSLNFTVTDTVDPTPAVTLSTLWSLSKVNAYVSDPLAFSKSFLVTSLTKSSGWSCSVVFTSTSLVAPWMSLLPSNWAACSFTTIWTVSAEVLSTPSHAQIERVKTPLLRLVAESKSFKFVEAGAVPEIVKT